jgi:uncharacterized protein YcbK (DUF882 family)
VSIESARATTVVHCLLRAGARVALAALFLLGAAGELQNAIAEGDTRTLSFHHVHTGEDITVTFKRNGRYDPAALKKLDWFMRDWRKEQSTQMDPRLFDILWQVYRETGATQPIQIICGYRSPSTNAMLRARSSGVARRSQHTEGHAIDFFIPGVKLATIRAIGLKLQRGGVGFYPSSGSPFVHMDTGSIRHWPGISREQLAKIFPDGRTVHIPSDGKPMRQFALALADVERHGDAPNALTLQKARDAGVITDHDVMVAQQEHAPVPAQPPSLLAALFGGGTQQNTETEADADEQVAEAAPAPKPARAMVASLSARKAESPVPLPTARPVFTTVAELKKPSAAPVATAAAENIFGARGYWPDAPALAPPTPIAPFEVASAGTLMTTGSTGVLAYAAAEPEVAPQVEPAAARARPMGRHVPQRVSAVTRSPNEANTSIVGKSGLPAMSIGGQRWGSPWLRAAMLTPSVAYSMRTTRLGTPDPRWLHSLLRKPSQSLVMTFSDDPQLGMVADRFSGDAVVFLATATFTAARTASLR